MGKIGRNSPCPCGSGKKYKKCCIDNLQKNREEQQGLGKPIISTKFKNERIVVVGDKKYSSKCKAFPDFLLDYLQIILGQDWINLELKKNLEERHPILKWENSYCKLHQKLNGTSGKVIPFSATGATNCLLGIAYNLYLLQHNVGLQQRYIERLKDINNFQGVYYELIVANCLIRSGFELELEDETDEQIKHCEFSAISKKTGKKYWVEAKSRSVAGIMGKTVKNGTTKTDPTCMLSKHIKEAFQKPANDERLIFIDVNTFDKYGTKPSWIERAAEKLNDMAKDINSEKSAYVFITNVAFHLNLDSDKGCYSSELYGLRKPSFAKENHLEFYRPYTEEQHRDIHDIFQAIKNYPKLPATFDGSLPEEAFKE